MTSAVRIFSAMPLAGLLLATAAHGETTASAVLTAEGGYGSNPFLGGSSDRQAGSLLGRIEPVVTVSGPTSQLSLTGRLEHVVFAEKYSDMTNWSVAGSGSLSLSPVSSLGVGANFASRVRSALSSLAPIGENGEIPPLDPSETELAGQRVQNMGGNASYSTSLSARDTFSISTYVTKVDYDENARSGYSYTSYGASASLSRALNARITLGGSVSYAQSNYESADYGRFRQVSPSINGNIKLSPRLTLSASAGASFSRIAQTVGTRNQAYFSGQATLCYSGIRSNLCTFISRSLGSSARAATSVVTSAGANYSYKLTARSGLNLGAQYSESSSASRGPATGIGYGYAVFSGGYSRDLGRRLSLSVNARYTEPLRSVARRQGFYGGVAVKYRLGR